MLGNQIEGKIIKQACEWDDHIVMTWDSKGAYVIYFPSQEKGEYDVHIFLLSKELLYKDIRLTLYVKIENVMDREHVFIA
jgi:hypothetical protein